jgi:signaling intermediate in Toll pathway protein
MASTHLKIHHQRRTFVTSCFKMEKVKNQEEFAKKMQLKQIRDTDLASKELFEATKAKNKETFMGALEIFKNRDVRRAGAVEFINAALKHLQAFGVQHDIEVYKSIIDVMPKGVYNPKNLVQAHFFHYPKQQECLCNLLNVMSKYKVYPDEDLGTLIQTITGRDSAPYR